MNRKIGVILSYIAMVFEVLSTLLLTPFIIRDLGEAEYGVYKLSASIVAYLLLLDCRHTYNCILKLLHLHFRLLFYQVAIFVRFS